MKFFHVYDERYLEGLKKNNLLNKDSGFKIQHYFSMANDFKFNKIAQKGSKLHSIIKENQIPFYVDRMAGGGLYHRYYFDKELIDEYIDILGDWFLGFQLHESSSCLMDNDWKVIYEKTGTSKGPYTLKELQRCVPDGFTTYYGEVLKQLGMLTVEEVAKYGLCYPETVEDCFEVTRNFLKKRMEEVNGRILPCDSFYLMTRMHNELGIKTFMPEVGWQIPMMRMEVAVVRGIAENANKTWGTYYEVWLDTVGDKCTLPSYNNSPANEWHLPQEKHNDDFTNYGPNGGSSRLLQNRIYYYSLMAGAHYMAEEWGLFCNYSDMNDFTLSPYGEVKKAFIHKAETLRGITAEVPFAIVLPKSYSCVQIREKIYTYKPNSYMTYTLSKSASDDINHIESVLELVFNKHGDEKPVLEDRVICNNGFGDVFDVIYEDANDNTFNKYEYLIDATKSGNFIAKKPALANKILLSDNLDKLSLEIKRLTRQIMPLYVDGRSTWLVSYDECGKRYLSVFNNEGNTRTYQKGDEIDNAFDEAVTITLKKPADLKPVVEGAFKCKLSRKDDLTYILDVPATSFAIYEF